MKKSNTIYIRLIDLNDEEDDFEVTSRRVRNVLARFPDVRPETAIRPHEKGGVWFHIDSCSRDEFQALAIALADDGLRIGF